jgi:hypothetical protein
MDVERTAAGRVLRINAEECYTKYELIPSVDGSIYGMGFGVLLGPLNESVNDLCNMLMDAGVMSVASGGFLARGVKIRGGVYSFSPFEWNRVDSTGDDLQKGIVPLPVREPSAVLFQLLTFLVDYTQRVGGATDAIQGQNPGQNTPAQTQQSMIEQGQKIYSGLFKRVWRCMKKEFGKLYVLNAKHLPIEKPFGMGGKITREDFLGDPSQIVPVADPNVTSEQMRLQLAVAVADRAQGVPGYNKEATERNLLSAMRVDGIDALYPGPDKVPPIPNPKVMVEQIRAEGKVALDKAKGEREMQMFALEMLQEERVNDAEIARMEAQAALFAAQADGEAQGKEIALINSMIGAAKARSEHIRGHIDQLLKAIELKGEQDDRRREGGTGAGGNPTPGAGAGGLAAGANDQALLSMGAA